MAKALLSSGKALGSVQRGAVQLRAVRQPAACQTARVPRTVVAGNLQRRSDVQLLANTAFLTAAASVLTPRAALAEDEGALVDTTVNTIIEAVKAAGSAVKSGLDAAGVGAEYVKQAYDQVAPVVREAADTAAPYVSSALKTASDVASPAIQAAVPTVKGLLSETDKALSQQGLNLQAGFDAAQSYAAPVDQAVTTAKPLLGQVLQFLTTTEPLLLGEYALGLVAAYYLAPPILKGVFGSLRGYAGDISPAAALDAVANQGNTYLIDIRTSREKESTGTPDLPSNGRLLEIEYSTIEDRKLRSQLGNISALELEVSTLTVAALKKINKGSTLLLLDRNGGTARAVAKELKKKGFKKAYVVSNGFNGWTGAKLAVKPSTTVSRVEVLPPGIAGTIMRAARGGNSTVSSRRALPSGR